MAAAVPAALHPHLTVRPPLPPHLQAVAAAHRPRPGLPPRRRSGRRRRSRHRDQRRHRTRATATSSPSATAAASAPATPTSPASTQDPTRRHGRHRRSGSESKDPPAPAPETTSTSRSRSTANRSTRCRSWPTAAHRSTAQPSHPALRRRRPTPLGRRRGGPEGGVGFPLPAPGRPRQDSLHNPPLPIPAKIKKLYVAAAARYKIPWTLAGRHRHGRNRARPQQPHQLRRRPRADAVHARHLGDRWVSTATATAAPTSTTTPTASTPPPTTSPSPASAPAPPVSAEPSSRTTTSTGTSTTSSTTPPATAAAPSPATPTTAAAGTGNPKLPSLTNERVAKRPRLGEKPRRRLLPDGGGRANHLGLLQLHPSRLRPDRRQDAPHRHRATQLAGRRQRHPHPTRPRETRRPDLLGLLPRTQHRSGTS